MTLGVVIAECNPIFLANSIEVNLRRIRLPMTRPKDSATVWMMLVFLAHRTYLIVRLSRDMSWMTIRVVVAMRRREKTWAS